MAVKHQAFIDLEEALARRLSTAWSRYWARVSGLITDSLERRDFDAAHRHAESIDVGPLFDRSRVFARTVGMSALLLGASRVRPTRESRVAKVPPKQELDAFVRQTDVMLSKNTSKALRELAHRWVDAVEREALTKADDRRPLYVSRRVLNADEVLAWAKSQGFEASLPADDLHVTVAYSRAAVDWQACRAPTGQLVVKGGARRVAPLGDEGAVVLHIESDDLQARWQQLRDAGCSWDYEGYQPHVTITYAAPDGFDVASVRPYRGPLVLGPEEFAPLDVEKFDPDQPRAPAGTPEGGQWISVTGTPEFKAWFGDSKVVDAEGKPLRVYHGTLRGGFSEFKSTAFPHSAGYFAEDPALANLAADAGRQSLKYLSPSVYPVYLSLQSPLDVTNLHAATVITAEAFSALLSTPLSEAERRSIETAARGAAQVPWSFFGMREVNAALRARGYDGVIYNEEDPATWNALPNVKRLLSGRAFIAFEANQIKSVFNSQPTMDPHLMKLEKRERPDHQVKIQVAGKQYFGIASSVQVSRLSAFGFLLEAAEAGIRNYRIDAIMDERTCAVCKQLDGWVFPVEAGMRQAQLIMDTDDIETLKQIAPFYAQNKQAVAELITYATDDWISMGMHLPPYHPLCRCILTPTDAPADIHPTQDGNRVALASAALYGEGDGVRLTRELFGVDVPAEDVAESIGDVIPEVEPTPEEFAAWLDKLTEPVTPPQVVEEEARAWVQDALDTLLAQPEAAVPPAALVTPTPFEGSTIPQQYVEPFRPSRLAQFAERRWPWLAGILGWLATAERDAEPGSAEEAELLAEEAEAEAERDERRARREDRRQ